MKRAILLCGVAAAAAIGCSAGTAAPTDDPVPTAAVIVTELVWAEEFDGDRLDPTRWRAEHSTYGTGGGSIHCYQPQNVAVSNGLLRLEAKEETVSCPGAGQREYTSGMVRTEGLASFTYGRFEVRMRAPSGSGLWAAAWLGSESKPYGAWPESGEIDIMEVLGIDPGVGVGSLHWLGPDGTPAKTTGSTAIDPDAFHVWALDWAPDSIEWSVDGVVYHRAETWDVPAGAQFPAPFDRPFAIRLNLAVGGSWPGDPDATTPWPSALEVDWVRVYEVREP